MGSLTNIIPIAALGSAGDNQNQPDGSSGSNLEDLYHRILDDSEFSSHANLRFNRHNFEHGRADTEGGRAASRFPPPPAPSSSVRVNNNRKINVVEPYRASVGSAGSVFDGLPDVEPEEFEGAADVPNSPEEEDPAHDHRALFERDYMSSVLRDSQAHGPAEHRTRSGGRFEVDEQQQPQPQHYPAYRRHRRSLLRRRSIRLKESIGKAEPSPPAVAGAEATTPTPEVPASSGLRGGAPKLQPNPEAVSTVQLSSILPRAGDDTGRSVNQNHEPDGARGRSQSETAPSPLSVASSPPAVVAGGGLKKLPQQSSDTTAGAITSPQFSLANAGSHYGDRPGPMAAHGAHGPAVGIDSFNLLDDSVFVAHRNDSERGRGGGADGARQRLPSLGTDLTLDANGNIFGGENFDEQIIFLNGPDLLETSVEQQAQSLLAQPVGEGRQLGKVAREAVDEPRALSLRPIIRGPSDDHVQVEDNVVVVYADQHETVRLNCEVDADITSSVWLKDGQIVHVMDKKSRTADIRFVREPLGGMTIANVMLEDDGEWQCEAENARGFFFNGRPIKLVVLDPPKEPYLLIDSRRLDAGNMFIPVKENSELTLACVSEGGNPKPALTWEVLLSPGIDRHAQKISSDVLELQEIKKDKDKDPYKINSGVISEVKLPAVFRVHHNARILCIMEHPTLKVRQNASILLDVQYTPSFAITRTPGFGYPLREGIAVSLKCDVDSNPPSTPVWQKDDGETPVPQIGDGFLNFSSIRREHSGWYKCTSRHLNFQYSSIGYYLSVRYEPVDVTSEPVEQDPPLSPSSSSSSSSSSASSSSSSASSSAANPASSSGAATGAIPSSGTSGAEHTGTNSFKGGQMEVELGGSVTLQCPQGSLGCWSHLDPVTARLKGLGTGIYTPTGHFSLKDVVYQDAGTYKCVGQSSNNRKKLEVLQTVSIAVKGAPSVSARNMTPVAYPGSPLHLSVEFCANPPAYAARWLHGDRVYTPGNQYGSDVLAYGFIDLPTPFCKEARLTYVHMHEKVPRTFYFVVSSPGGVAEAVFRVNYTLKHKQLLGSAGSATASGAGSGTFGSPFSLSASSSASGGVIPNGGPNSGYKINTNTINTVPGGNQLDGGDEELMEPEEIHFPSFGRGTAVGPSGALAPASIVLLLTLLLLPLRYSSCYLS
ncbi:uncharacterized protein LOC128278555 [Anopheles cruzii]|uniref:uncharacterized protein LOC128278555 n=1 Tax=Anopheles cruzii TaxID=68878 RepID=UPI0022EC68F4|nr:uncharacterized protein LOC128278555 [Anopheles cruzii]